MCLCNQAVNLTSFTQCSADGNITTGVVLCLRLGGLPSYGLSWLMVYSTGTSTHWCSTAVTASSSSTYEHTHCQTHECYQRDVISDLEAVLLCVTSLAAVLSQLSSSTSSLPASLPSLNHTTIRGTAINYSVNLISSQQSLLTTFMNMQASNCIATFLLKTHMLVLHPMSKMPFQSLFLKLKPRILHFKVHCCIHSDSIIQITPHNFMNTLVERFT